MSDQKSASGLSPLLKLGEDKLTQLLTQLLGNEAFVTSLQDAIGRALKAKGSVDKGLIRLLSAFNVPTVEDVALMQQKLAEMEEAMAEMAGVVAALETRVRDGAGDKPGRKPRAR